MFGGELLSIVGLYGRISRGAGEAVVYPVADVSGSSPLISILIFQFVMNFSFMGVEKILPFSTTLGWH